MPHVLKIFLISLLFANVIPAKRKLCGARLQLFLTRTCTFAYEKTPCFNSRFPSSSRIRTSGARTFGGIANQCCEKGCELRDLRATCCFKESCLKRCYPNSGYGRRRTDKKHSHTE